jgi:hypothetical protein
MRTCSALARAGKSVLLLDSTESYGGSWASLSGPDYVHGLINRQLEYQLSAKQQQQQQQQQQGQQQQDAPSQEGAGSSSSEHCSIALHAVHPLLGASGVSLYTHPDVEQALENKHLLMDLAPRVRASSCVATGKCRHTWQCCAQRACKAAPCNAGCRAYSTHGPSPACTLFSVSSCICLPQLL